MSLPKLTRNIAEKNRTTSNDYIKPDIIHYSNCWGDARVLLKALHVKEGGVYLSIASSGDNTLSLLAHNPSAVFAIDAWKSAKCLLFFYHMKKYCNFSESMMVLAKSPRITLYDHFFLLNRELFSSNTTTN